MGCVGTSLRKFNACNLDKKVSISSIRYGFSHVRLIYLFKHTHQCQTRWNFKFIYTLRSDCIGIPYNIYWLAALSLPTFNVNINQLIEITPSGIYLVLWYLLKFHTNNIWYDYISYVLHIFMIFILVRTDSDVDCLMVMVRIKHLNFTDWLFKVIFLCSYWSLSASILHKIFSGLELKVHNNTGVYSVMLLRRLTYQVLLSWFICRSNIRLKR